MRDLACLLIPQEIFPQSPVITDTELFRKFPSCARFLGTCARFLGSETNILRNLCANL